MDDEQLIKILKEVDLLLWSSYEVSFKHNYINRKNNLIFPVYHNNSEKGLRVSEQEARFLFAHVIQKSDLLFSIETPTFYKYMQKGKKKISTQIDMTLFDNKGKKILNIEFKSNTISINAKNSFPISKDIEKIFSEQIKGCWFHVLESVNNSSITNLLSTLKRDIKNLKIKKSITIRNKILVIHICVLKHGFSLTKIFNIDNFQDDFFYIDYEVSKTKLLNFNNSTGWELYKKTV